MPNLDWSQCSAVESIPGKVSGAWVFRNTRMPVATVFENLEDMSIEEVMEQFDITREQIEAVLEFVAQSLRPPGYGAAIGARRCSFSLTTEHHAVLRICFDHGQCYGLGRAEQRRPFEIGRVISF
jgi:uncharacterized protein (DUF433 family)